ncbi:carboxypeptidase regulatory-like domain-containing protein [Agromyces seonyuensis]|uniref:alpha-amylase n=1 Tax=Agromyces seonyuensis TaxID=2662446 RepID=A0A6I4NW56_9MICO|nr:carboxypeptidase regulatory-like domain-containing protein [Agromyces seonyuensis]MWB98598.1 hypothetical protein [Agromyces seonyuensis]
MRPLAAMLLAAMLLTDGGRSAQTSVAPTASGIAGAPVTTSEPVGRAGALAAAPVVVSTFAPEPQPSVAAAPEASISDAAVQSGESWRISGIATTPDGQPVRTGRAKLAQLVTPTGGAPYWLWIDSQYIEDDTGQYTFSGTSPGTYSIGVDPYDSEFAETWWPGVTELGQTQGLEIVLGGDYTRDLVVAAGARISGTVQRADSSPHPLYSGGWGSFPLLDLHVYRLAPDGRFAEQNRIEKFSPGGGFTVGGLRAGTYVLKIATNPYDGDHELEQWWGGTSINDATRIVLADGEHRDDVRIRMAEKGSISGQVTANGAPLAGVRVTLTADVDRNGTFFTHNGQTWTDDDGRYTIRALEAGDYRVKFLPQDEELLAEWWPAAPVELEARAVPVELGAVSAGIDADLHGGSTVSGRVLRPDGSPSKTRVELYRRVLVDGAGTWAYVGMTSNTGPYLTANVDGGYRSNPVWPGEYTARFVSLEDLEDVWLGGSTEQADAATFTVLPGQDTTGIDAQPPAKASISGVVTRDDGFGPQVMSVDVYREIDGEWAFSGTTKPDALGAYRVGGLDPGTYTVKFNADKYRELLTEWWGDQPTQATARRIDLGWREAVIGIDAQIAEAGEITGTVTIENGGNKGGGTVRAYRRVLIDGIPEWQLEREASILGYYQLLKLRAGACIVQYEPGGGYATEWSGDAPDAASARIIEVIGGMPVRTDIAIAYPTALQSAAPTISGSPVVGRTLAVQTGDWQSGAVLATQWFADGDAIPSATGTSLLLGPENAGRRISVAVTGVLAGYPAVTRSSTPVQVDSGGTAPLPGISGQPAVGGTLTAHPGDWPSGTTFAYQWYADHTPISGATGISFVLGAAQQGARIFVRVTGTNGSSVEVRASEPTRRAILGSSVVVQGSPAVGQFLQAVPTGWPAETSFDYQWYADGVLLPLGGGPGYVPPPSRVGQIITVRITAWVPGSTEPVVRSSVSMERVSAAGVPTISGMPKIGATLTASPGDWADGTALTYQWAADGIDILGATASTFVPTLAQRDLALTVTVRGVRPGYATAVATSSPTAGVVS